MTKQERKEIKKVIKFLQKERWGFCFTVCSALDLKLFSWPKWADEAFLALDDLIMYEADDLRTLERRDLYLSALLSELTLND